MPTVYLGLGSNAEPEHNLRLGVQELARRFSLTGVSRVYRNQALGFEGDDFLNAVASIETDMPVEQIASQLDEIHDLAGRRRGESRYVSRTLDIDLLLYADEIIPQWRVPRPDVLEYSFVLRPLAEIAPNLCHPVTGKTMAEHWAGFSQDQHPLLQDRLILLNGED
jgi:2-amino-4-hydroxy-6-hydroxymethyldihydropteridine diphosphokinase